MYRKHIANCWHITGSSLVTLIISLMIYQLSYNFYNHTFDCIHIIRKTIEDCLTDDAEHTQATTFTFGYLNEGKQNPENF